ncbi:unnamed protein product [Coffea canephora]|uniref:Uncharacterized protein n=1 Tax=Coffea canephora TaxID=49390 RepID=A0A068U7E9_COFCA|nr:unnamed protein product [Coffea canephora]
MGRHAKAIKRGKESEGSERGPLWKANMRSLKLESHATKKAVVTPRCKVWSLRGRYMKRQIMGRNARNLGMPFWTIFPAK